MHPQDGNLCVFDMRSGSLSMKVAAGGGVNCISHDPSLTMAVTGGSNR